MIPYGRQQITQKDIDSIIKVLKSDFLTQGPKVQIFEKEVLKFCGSKYSIAVNSATSALHLSCLALGLKKDDWLWTSPISFVASANCGLYCGAKIDLIDIDPKTYNISIEKLSQKLKEAQSLGRLPKIVITSEIIQPAEISFKTERLQKQGERIFNLSGIGLPLLLMYIPKSPLAVSYLL